MLIQVTKLSVSWFKSQDQFVPIWIENSYLHSLLHTCVRYHAKRHRMKRFFFFLFHFDERSYLKHLFFYARDNAVTMMENQKECTLSKIIITRHSKPRKNRWRKFNATKARSSISVLTKYQIDRYLTIDYSNVTTSMLQSDRLFHERGSTRRLQR